MIWYGFASSTPTLTLNPWATLPLKPGRIYTVEVRVSFDGGATYCPFGPSCTIRTRYPLAASRDMEPAGGPDGSGFSLFPNPAEGAVVTLVPVGIDGSAQVELIDLTGRVLSQRTVTVTDAVSLSLELDGVTGSGLYLVRLTAGGTSWVERLMVR